MTATTGVAFLGLSVGCARCHDHKFDPIPAEDYYRMAATFTTTIRSEIDARSARREPAKMQVTSEGFPHTKHNADGRGFPHFYPATYILSRGDVNQKKREAKPGFLRVLMSGGRDVSSWRIEPPRAGPRTTFDRAALAELAHRPRRGAGALAARVAVNRLWQHHFGRGIVATPNDFGAQGQRPSHPELLEWLADELVQGGWRLKPLHKRIVTSAVYIQGDLSDEPRARSTGRTSTSGGVPRGGSKPSRSATPCSRSPGCSTSGCPAPVRSTRRCAGAASTSSSSGASSSRR